MVTWRYLEEAARLRQELQVNPIGKKKGPYKRFQVANKETRPRNRDPGGGPGENLLQRLFPKIWFS